MSRDKRSGFSWTASNIRIWSVVSQEYVVLLKTDLGYSQAGTYLGDDHKQYFSGDAALKAGGKDNTMNQFDDVASVKKAKMANGLTNGAHTVMQGSR